MNTIKIESDKEYILIPLEEYNRLKSIEEEYEDLNLSSEDEERLSQIEEKIGKGDYSDFIDYKDFKESVVQDRKKNS
jgi:PHD/YefM family antitoxin component YafN of YafNO toxin-antitoxin module